jgi:hypothetical protein
VRHRTTATVALVLALSAAVAGCGGDDDGSADVEERGVRARAVEQLRDFGLPAEQARCVVDELGAETVAAASEMDVLAAGQPYQDAVAACPA